MISSEINEIAVLNFHFLAAAAVLSLSDSVLASALAFFFSAAAFSASNFAFSF